MKTVRKQLVTAVALGSAMLSSSASMAQVQEIIITAEMRDTNVQDTPLAVTATSGEMMEARNQTNLFQVSAQAPNVTLTQGGSNAGPAMFAFIRGVGQTDFNYAVEPGVGIYVDDVYYPTLTGTMLDLLDLNRVEILRGPQGTLSGRNSIGGSIKLFSVKPGTGAGNHVYATMGSYDRTDFGGAADVTLIENELYARFSGLSHNEDGYVERLDYGCVHPDSGVPRFLAGGDVHGCKLGTLGGRSVTSLRGQLRWTPSDDLEINIAYDRTNDDSEAQASVLKQVNGEVNRSNAYGEGTFIESTIDGSPIYYDNKFVTHGAYRGDGRIDDFYTNYNTFLNHRQPMENRPYAGPNAIPPINHLNQQGGSVNIDYQINPDLALKSITSFREYDATWAQAVGNAPIHSQHLLQRLNHRAYSQEIRLSGIAMDGFLDYTVGAFYFDQNGTLNANVSLWYAQLEFIHGPDPTPSNTKAVFANTAWHLSDLTNLTVGLRFSEDEKDYTFFRSNPDGSIPGPCTAPAPPASLLNPPNCALVGLYDVSDTFKDDRVDWRVALDHAITDDIMVYGQIATGYKAGGVNPRPFFPVQISTVDPEEIISYETGFKSVLWDNRLQFNATVFFNEYTDIQLQQTRCAVPPGLEDPADGLGAPCLQPANGGDADVWGIELESQLYLDNGWSFDASLSTFDFEYTQVADNVPVTEDMITPFSPELTWSLGAQFEHQLFGGSIMYRLDASYQDDMYSNSTNIVNPQYPETNLIKDYTLINGRITWRDALDEWEFSLEGNNLTGEEYYLHIYDQINSSGTVEATPAKPRTFAATIKRRF